MAINSIKEIPARREHYVTDRQVRVYRHTYQVVLDSRTQAGGAILEEAWARDLFPKLNSFYSYGGYNDDGASLIRISPRESIDSPYLYFLECEWSSESVYADDYRRNPLERRPQIRIGSKKVSEVAMQDINGSAIANSAGDPFSPPLEKTRRILTVNYTRNEDSFNAAKARRFLDKTNNAIWNGFDPKTVLMDDIQGEQMYENGILFWRVNYVIDIHYRDWRSRILDIGMRQLIDGVRRPIILAGGVIANYPVLLNGSGGVNAVGATPVFRNFDLHETINFNELNIVLE